MVRNRNSLVCSSTCFLLRWVCMFLKWSLTARTPRLWLRCTCARRSWCSSTCATRAQPSSRSTSRTSSSTRTTRRSSSSGFPTSGESNSADVSAADEPPWSDQISITSTKKNNFSQTFRSSDPVGSISVRGTSYHVGLSTIDQTEDTIVNVPSTRSETLRFQARRSHFTSVTVFLMFQNRQWMRIINFRNCSHSQKAATLLWFLFENISFGLEKSWKKVNTRLKELSDDQLLQLLFPSNFQFLASWCGGKQSIWVVCMSSLKCSWPAL